MTDKQTCCMKTLEEYFRCNSKRNIDLATLNSAMDSNIAASTITSLVKAGKVRRVRIGDTYRYSLFQEDKRTEDEKLYDEYEEAAERLYGLYSHINNSYSCWYNQFEECGIEFPFDIYNAWYNAVTDAVSKKQKELNIECKNATGKPLVNEMIYFTE